MANPGANDDALEALMENMSALDGLLGEASALSITSGNATSMPDLQKPTRAVVLQSPQQLANPPAGTSSPWMPGALEDVSNLTAQRQAAEERASKAEARAAAAEASMKVAEERAARMEKEAAEATAKAAKDATAAAKRKKREAARSRWKSAGQIGRATGLLFGAADHAAEKTAAAEAERAAAEAGVAAMQADPEWIEPDDKLVALVGGLSRPMEANDVDLHAVSYSAAFGGNVPQVGAAGGSLLVLSLAAASLAPRDAELLAEYLHLNAAPGLTSLNLSSNAIGAPGLRSIAQVLPLTAIASLDLTRNHVCTWFSSGDESAGLDGLDFSLAGLHALSDAIPRSGLTALSLRHNELSPAGAAVISTALGHAGCSLICVDLGWCSLGSEGVGVIGRILPQAHALNSLDLTGNVGADDGDEGGWVPLLAEALPRAQGLRTLGLAANRLAYARIPSQLAKRQEQYLHGIGGGSRTAAGSGIAPGQLAPHNVRAGAGNENVAALSVLAPAVAMSNLLTLRLAANALDARGLLALGRSLCRSKLTTLDLSFRLSPGEGPMEGTEEHTKFYEANGGVNATDQEHQDNQQQPAEETLRLCRLYQGSSTGVALQLLNALVCAMPSASSTASTSAALGTGGAGAANASSEPMLHWVARRGWVDWSARLLSLRHSDLYILDQDGQSVLEVATPEVARLVQDAHARIERPPELAVTYAGGLVFRSFDGSTELIDELDPRPLGPAGQAALEDLAVAGIGGKDDSSDRRRVRLPVAAGDGREMLEGIGAVTLRTIQAAMVGTVRSEVQKVSTELRDEVAALAQSCRDLASRNQSYHRDAFDTGSTQRAALGRTSGGDSSTALVRHATESTEVDGSEPAVWEMPSSIPVSGQNGVQTDGDEPWTMRSWIARESADPDPEAEDISTNVITSSGAQSQGPRTAPVATTSVSSTARANANDSTQQPGDGVQHAAQRSAASPSVVEAAVEAAGTTGGHGMEHAIRTITAEQERCRNELVELRLKLEASILAGQVPEDLAASVAEAVCGQERVLRMLLLQGEAQHARLALPGEVVVEGGGVGSGPTLASVSKSVADLSHQVRSLQNELLNGGGSSAKHRGRSTGSGGTIRNALCCGGRLYRERRSVGVTEASPQSKMGAKKTTNVVHPDTVTPEPKPKQTHGGAIADKYKVSSDEEGNGKDDTGTVDQESAVSVDLSVCMQPP